MNILQEYEKQRDLLGEKTMDAISAYLDYLDKNRTTLFYSDIIYKKEEWEKFENWCKTMLIL